MPSVYQNAVNAVTQARSLGNRLAPKMDEARRDVLSRRMVIISLVAGSQGARDAGEKYLQAANKLQEVAAILASAQDDLDKELARLRAL